MGTRGGAAARRGLGKGRRKVTLSCPKERDRRDCKAADAGQGPQSAWGSGGKDAVEDWRSWSQWNQKAQREWKDWKGGWREWSGAGDKDPNRHTHVLAAFCIVQYAFEQSQICLKEEWSKKQRQGRQKRCSRGLARLLLTSPLSSPFFLSPSSRVSALIRFLHPAAQHVLF